MENIKLTERIAALTLKFYQLNDKARKNDITSLEDDFENNQKKYRDIFDYGILLCVNGIETALLEKILSNLVLIEKDEQEKRFKAIQKEAVLLIKKGKRSRLFLCSLFEFLNINEIKEIQINLGDSVINNDFELLLSKPSDFYKEEIYNDDESSAEIKIKPFNFINDTDDNIFFDHLKTQKPQIIAYILTLLEGQKAAFLLSKFSGDIQDDIMYHILIMEKPNINILSEVLLFEKRLLNTSGKKYEYFDSTEFENLLRKYLVRKNTVKKAVELYKRALNAETGGKEAACLTKNLLQIMRGKPIDFLKTNPQIFYDLLKEEHIKTIAYVLSFIDPQKAGYMLSSMPGIQAGAAACLIALMEPPPGEVSPPQTQEEMGLLSKDEIAATEKKISAMFNKKCILQGGIEKLVNILKFTDRNTEKNIIDFLSENYPVIIKPILESMFLFEDIVMLDDRAIQKVMRDADSEVLAKALKDADTEVQDKIFKNMSKRAAFMLKEDMEWMKAASAEESLKAKKKIVSIVMHLEETGEIVVSRSGEEEIVV